MSTLHRAVELPTGVVEQFAAIVGRDSVLTDPADCLPYGYDNSRMQAMPQAVLFATTTQQIVGLVQICRQHGIGLIARGRATGTTGATVPQQGGVVLSLERMNRILDVDLANRTARVEPGVTNRELQLAIAEQGLFWPPDPTSSAICTIGGNLAYNSAGPRAVKYGTPRENILGLTAVTGAGEVIRTGVSTTKGVVGYDLTRLLVGSEGTLAIITEATLKLTPIAEARQTMRATYSDIHTASRAVSSIMAQPVTPCALEFMDRAALDMVRDFSGLELSADVGALLMIEVDGPSHCLAESVGAVEAAARNEGTIDIQTAQSEEEIAQLWKAREALSPALRSVAPKKINEDVVVPVSRIPELIDGLSRLSAEKQIRIVNFGHAGNGNIHVNLLVDPDDPEEMARSEECLNALFDLVLDLNGTISGEHGIGLVKRGFVSRELDPVALRLMLDIKGQFDPDGILNPGKMLPELP